MRQPVEGVHIVRILVEDQLTRFIDSKGGHLNGLGGPWYLEKRQGNEPMEMEVQPEVIQPEAPRTGGSATTVGATAQENTERQNGGQ